MGRNKNLILWLLVIFTILSFASSFKETALSQKQNEQSYSTFLDAVEKKQIKSVVMEGQDITAKTVSGTEISTYAPYDQNLIERMRAAGIDIDVKPPVDKSGAGLGDFILAILPVCLLIGAWFYFMKQAGAGNNKAMGFGKSKAKLVANTKKITFADVAGVDEAKEELEEVVEFLREPAKFQRLGGRIPRGVLLSGDPGTGKTLLAKAVAGEANVPFFQISGSDFVEMFVGVGASRVRDMFSEAKQHAPCILFIDEIDAVGGRRGNGFSGGHEEREQTLNQLLVEMDGFDASENVIVIAATNRADMLDPALLRPGRFDREVTVSAPDVAGREGILKIHTRKIPLAKDVKLSIIARGTPGFTGAELANLVNEAALYASRNNRNKVTLKDFDEARDKVMMGKARKSMIMDENEKINTAYHEAGHAICSMFMPDTDPIHKATIIPRGRALGMVQPLPEKDHYSISKRKMISKLVLYMGGRAAEIIKNGEDVVTSGPSGDIQGATNLARAMVTKWGMSDILGPVLYDKNSYQEQNYSEETAQVIDSEVRRLISEAQEKAFAILNEHDKEWRAVAEALIEYETLTGDEIKAVMNGEKIDKTGESPVSEEKRTQSSVPEL